MKQGQIDRYLERIGYRGEIALDETGLDRLLWAHLCHVPFENLESFEGGRVPSLKIEDIYKKVVEKNRGGYCFELNRLFSEFLRDLGFEVRSVGARVCWMREHLPAMTHRAGIVRIGNRDYLADVGYGGPGPKGILALSEKEIQFVRGSAFKVTRPQPGRYQIEREYENAYAPMLLLEDRFIEEADFDIMNYYCAKSPNSLFTQKYIVSICRENGSAELAGNCLTIKEGGQVAAETIDTERKRKTCLKKYFGIETLEPR